MLFRNAALILAYFITGKLGVLLASTGGGYAAPVWLPTGIAFAAVLMWGWKLLPGVWIGAFLTNVSISSDVGHLDLKHFWLSAGIATGNMGEAVVARLMLAPFFTVSNFLGKTRNVLAYVGAAAAAPAISAFVGVTALGVAGNLGGTNAYDTIVTWWIGDSVGAVLVAPLVFGYPAARTDERKELRLTFPYLLLFVTLGALIVNASVPNHMQPVMAAILVFATLILASISLPLRHLSCIILAISTAAVYRSYLGFGASTLITDRVQRVLMMQFVLASATIIALMLHAAITEKVEALRQAHQREVALMTANRTAAIGQMAAGIAHEINNPLTVLSSRAQLLRAHARENKLQENEVLAASEKIIAMTERITKIVRSLYFFSRKSDSDPFETVPIRQIIDETVELCSKHFKDSGVRLEVDKIDEKLSLRCRPVEVGQLILNLLTNAAAAVKSPSPPDGPQGWVTLSAIKAGSNLELSVTDSGTGISEDLKNKIFDPFFTTKAPGQGTGLGLSISREVAITHGGHLFLDDTGPNTRFVARLPLKEG